MKKRLISAVLCATLMGCASAQDGIEHARVPIKIVAVGNSITDGYGNSSRDKAWPGQLSKLLGSKYSMVNCGVSGTTMSRAADASYWNTGSYTNAKNAKPDILIISLGTNDADKWRWDQYGKDFEADYRAMIAEFRKTSDPVLFFCIAPPKYPLNCDQDRIIKGELTQKVKNLAKEYNAILVDFYTPLNNHPELFPDEIHPDDHGSAVQAQTLYKLFEKYQNLDLTIEPSNGTVVDERAIVIKSGSNVTITPNLTDGEWKWTGPRNFSSTERVLTLNNITTGGVYVVHRTDPTTKYVSVDKVVISIEGQKASAIKPYIQIGNGSWEGSNSATARPGETIHFGPQADGNVEWTWSGPDGFFGNDRDFVVPTVAYEGNAGVYIATVTDPTTGRQNSAKFNITVAGTRVCPDLKPNTNRDGWTSETELIVSSGKSVQFGPQPLNGSWSWTGPNGYTADIRTAAVRDFNEAKSGDYIGTYTNEAGCEASIVINLTLGCPTVTPYILYNNEWLNVSELTIKENSNIQFGPHPMDAGTWTWVGPNNFKYTGREPSVNNVTYAKSGTYTATYNDGKGCIVTHKFKILIEGKPDPEPEPEPEPVTKPDDNKTPIKSIQAAQSEGGAWFDLQGHKVDPKNITTGIYIHDGQKVVVK